MINSEENPERLSEEPSNLDRESLINNPQANRNKKGVFGFILMGLAAILLLFLFNGKEKPKEGLQKEAVEFEPASKRPITFPEAPPALLPPVPDTSEADLAKAQAEEALRQARLKSAILVYGSHSEIQTNANAGEIGSSDSLNVLSGTTNANSQFQERLASKASTTAKASLLGNLNRTILQGKLIDAVLETAIHSDLPGMIRAMVSQDVYAEQGENVLIPKGSRLVGQYNSEIAKGQSRIFVVWSRVIRPDGVEVALNSGGVDPLGRAGLHGKVNNHFWKIFGNSLLLSIIGAGASNAGVDTTDANNSIAAYRQQAQEAFQNSAGRILEEAINIPPTITIKQGSLIKVLVAQDLDFSEVSSNSNLVMLP